jgi:hypothetical protein
MAISKWAIKLPEKDIKIKVTIPTDITIEIPWYEGEPLRYTPDEFQTLVEKMLALKFDNFTIETVKQNQHLKFYSEDIPEQVTQLGQAGRFEAQMAADVWPHAIGAVPEGRLGIIAPHGVPRPVRAVNRVGDLIEEIAQARANNMDAQDELDF